MNMKENPEGIHRQFKKCSVLTNTESHYSGSSERLIIPITEEDKKRDREQIKAYMDQYPDGDYMGYFLRKHEGDGGK